LSGPTIEKREAPSAKRSQAGTKTSRLGKLNFGKSGVVPIPMLIPSANKPIATCPTATTPIATWITEKGTPKIRFISNAPQPTSRVDQLAPIRSNHKIPNRTIHTNLADGEEAERELSDVDPVRLVLLDHVESYLERYSM
jgi:hypothetical protein